MATEKEFLEREAALTDLELEQAQIELGNAHDNVKYWENRIAELTEASIHLKTAAAKADTVVVGEIK